MATRTFEEFINKSTSIQIDSRKRDWMENYSDKKRMKFKVVSVTEIDNISNAVKFLSSEKFVKFFVNALHLFAIFMTIGEDFAETLTLAEIKTIENCMCMLARPVLIIFDKTSSTEIYYMEPNDTCFRRFCIIKNKIVQDFTQNLYFVSTFAKAFDILNDSHTAIDKKIDKLQNEFIEAINGGSVLSLAFLSLFQNLRKLDLKVIVDRIVQANDCNAISACFDIPFNVSVQTKLSGNKTAVKLLLIEATKKGKEKIVGFILKKFRDVCYIDDGSLPQLAFKLNHFDILCKLLKANFAYPKEYLKIKVEELRENIKLGNLNFCKQFVKENPNIKCNYSAKIETIFTTALKHNKFEIFAFLESFYRKGNHDNDSRQLIDKLSVDNKNKLLEARKIFTRNNEKSYLYDLIKKSSHDGQHSNKINRRWLATIEKVWKILDTVPIVSTIMEIISRGKVANIHFLFATELVNDYDPTKTVNLNGITYTAEKKIVIGAKFFTEEGSFLKGLSILSHEMAHLAIHIIFQNGGLPYFNGRADLKLKFQKIVDKYCDLVLGEIIKDVYTNGYSEHEMIKELIVCVPEIETFHMNDTKELTNIKSRAIRLFTFYDEDVEKEFLNWLSLVGVRQEARELNDSYGKLDDLEENHKITSQDKTLTAEMKKFMKQKIVPKKKVQVYFSNKPQKVLADLYSQLNGDAEKLISSDFIFATLEPIECQSYFKEAMNCLEPHSLPELVIDASSYDKFQHSARKILPLIKTTSKTTIVAHNSINKQFLETIVFKLGVELSEKVLNFPE